MITRTLFFMLFLTSSNIFGQVSIDHLLGDYQFINKDLDSGYLTLKADSSFTYFWRWNDYKGLTKGKWMKKKEYIFLKSDTLPNLKSNKNKYLFTVKATKDSTIKNSIIRLKDVNGLPIMDANCWTGKSEFKTDSVGIGKFKENNAKYISISMKFADSFIIVFNKEKNNVFDITVLDVNLKYLYKKNERLLPVYINDTLFLREGFIDKKTTYEFKKIK
jgi:hypothetical protein